MTKVFHLKDYGFLLDEKGSERFVHARDFVDSREWPRLQEGARVCFEQTMRPFKAGKTNNGLGVKGVVLANGQKNFS